MQVRGAFKSYIAEVESFPVECIYGLMKALLMFCTKNQSLLDSHKVFFYSNHVMKFKLFCGLC